MTEYQRIEYLLHVLNCDDLNFLYTMQVMRLIQHKKEHTFTGELNKHRFFKLASLKLNAADELIDFHTRTLEEKGYRVTLPNYKNEPRHLVEKNFAWAADYLTQKLGTTGSRILLTLTAPFSLMIIGILGIASHLRQKKQLNTAKKQAMNEVSHKRQISYELMHLSRTLPYAKPPQPVKPANLPELEEVQEIIYCTV